MLARLIRYTFRLFAAFMLLSGFSACNKKLDLIPTSIVSQANQWKSLEDARSGVMGMYGLLRTALAEGNNYWLWGELRKGNFRSVTRPDLKAVIESNLKASYPLVQNATDWRRFYAAINSCNVLIENLESCLKDQRYTEAYYDLDIAQARALRAFTYFLMVRIWGDVPLITTSGEGKNFEQIARTSEAHVLSFAKAELEAVAKDLPFIYSGEDLEFKFPTNYYDRGSGFWLNAPFTRLAAYAILAHISAWQGSYLDVATYTDFVISNADKANVYLTTTDNLVSPQGLFAGGFDNYRQLVAFPFIKDRGETTIDGHIENLTLANTTAFAMSKQLPDIYVPKERITSIFFEADDDRFSINQDVSPPQYRTAYFENFNAEIPVFKKIRVIDGGQFNNGKFAVFNSSIIFTRLEEIKLLKAEAMAVLGNNQQAFLGLNEIRLQRGLPIALVNDKENLLYAIFTERTRELMGEGWFWYDLIRFNKLLHFDNQLTTWTGNGGIYWPVSNDVLKRNPKITQTEFWK
ncbi:RagB/SusD family nutrient uptake outer membrane protein [Niabella sp. CC-SYL272]|uniref:RagB/SusD family nutrient uptake outer membrane protein n=1 Tax=Niabella agricola TaxID=2891571 RepID=UPI001F39E99A|nr:RagB/SusD family nutrient uptake outer membrane protein [Niabella agricola]MCF3110402.1 RagB/SusD family nutrient uptake outer membrane protein [Niabella agricola]